METLKNRRFLVSRKSLISAKMNPNVVALSLGITSVVLYILCLIVVAITPVPVVVNVVNAFQHSIDVSGIATKSISFTGSLIGIVGWFIIAAVTGYIFAFVYNSLIGRL